MERILISLLNLLNTLSRIQLPEKIHRRLSPAVCELLTLDRRLKVDCSNLVLFTLKENCTEALPG